MNLNKVIGHEKVVESLRKSIEIDQISHSYLFEGEESIGKRMVALLFSKTLLCKEQGLEPCNRCNSCLKFDNWNHPDFKLIEPKKNLIKKKEIDDLIKSMSIAPLESKRKIVIIDNSDQIGVEGQNGLLKTLEEPPPYINMILISSNSNNLIPTILSRCQVLKFYPVNNEKIERLLKRDYNKTSEEASFIAHFTKGSVGRSIILSSSDDFFHRRDKVLEIINNIVKGDKPSVFNSVDFFIENKEFIDELLDIIIYWFRDLIIYKEIGESKLIINRDKLPLLIDQSFLSFNKINDIIENIIEARKNIKRNVNYQLIIETMLLNIQEVNI